MQLGDRAHGLEPADPAQDAAGEVGVEPDPLPVGLGEAARLLPHRVRHAHPAEVVHVRRPSYPRDVGGGSPSRAAAAAASSATAREWPTVNGHFRSTKSPIACRSASSPGVVQDRRLGPAPAPAPRTRRPRRAGAQIWRDSASAPRTSSGSNWRAAPVRAPSPARPRRRTSAGAPRTVSASWTTRVAQRELGTAVALPAARPVPPFEGACDGRPARTRSRPMCSAIKPADRQCEWISAAIRVRGVTSSVSSSRARSDSGRSEPVRRTR